MILSPLWLPVTVAAALFQCWRTALQQRLRGHLSVNAAAVVRYLYGVPVGAANVGKGDDAVVDVPTDNKRQQCDVDMDGMLDD